MHENTSIANQPQNSPTAVANDIVSLPDQQMNTETNFVDRFPIQLKLSVGAPNDPLEHEADAMADKVMRMPDMPFVHRKSADEDSCAYDDEHVHLKPLEGGPMPLIQRSECCSGCEYDDEHVHLKPLAGRVAPFIQAKSSGMGVAPYDDEHVRMKPLASQVTPFIQAKSDTGGTVSDAVSGRIKSSMGGGSSMSGETKSFMESRFGTDFSDVKIHSGGEAAQLSQALNAKAFTVSNNIYFNNGQYQPDSDSGKHLLAHELTHTIQQGSSVKRKELIQRVPAAAAATGPKKGVLDKAKNLQKATKVNPLDRVKRILYVPEIQIPDIKKAMMPGVTTNYAFKKTPRSDTHIAVWDAAATTGGKFDKKFDDKVKAEINDEASAANFFMKPKTEGASSPLKQLITGDKNQIRNQITRPFWDVDGNNIDHGYDVDHKVELQLGGLDGLGNLWLLEAATNRSSGSNINTEINNKVKTVLTDNLGDKADLSDDYLSSLRERYTITAGKLTDGLPVTGSGKGWELSQIKNGEHLDGLSFISKNSANRKTLAKNDNLSLILSDRYGVRRNFPWVPAAGNKWQPFDEQIGKEIKSNGATLRIIRMKYTDADQATIINTGSTGQATITAFRDSKLLSKALNTDVDITPVPGIYGGRLNMLSVKQAISSDIKARGLSPIIIDDLDINETSGLIGSGRIITDVPLIKGSAIKLTFDEDGIKISKIFSAGDIKLPKPFKISDTSLEVYVTQDGIGVKGEVNFEISKLGKGKLSAKADSAGTFALAGSFDFDSKTFDPARVEVNYLDGQLSVKGEIGIPEGNKIKGLKSAHATIGYANDSLTAEGSGEFNIKGIKQSNVTIGYANDQLIIKGDFELDNGIPGVKSGGGSIKVTRGGDGKYHVSAKGHAEPDIPKINPKLSISYDDGALTMEGEASYTAEKLSGSVTVGATNRKLDADGQPTGTPGDHFNVYGTGSLTVMITDWLQGTAKLKLTPNKEIEVFGRLEIPKPINFFERKEIKKPLFHPPAVVIPIFAIPLGNYSIGVVGEIKGGLDFDAGIGPGQLRNVFAEIKYNPSRPDDTTFKAGAEVGIPAGAGITLSAYAGLGLGAGPARVTGGIEISGRLGLDGEAKAKAEVNWSPKDKLSIDALGTIEVHPRFTFNVDAKILASLDLLVTSFDHEWKKNLASFSFGPDMQASVSMPVHYKEGEPFKMSTDDIQVTYPHIDIPEMAKGLGVKAKEAIFG